MAIRPPYPSVEIYKDKSVTISKVVTPTGEIFSLKLDTSEELEHDVMPLVQVSDTEYRPRASVYRMTYFSTVYILFHYRERLIEATGIDFFAGIHVDDIGVV